MKKIIIFLVIVLFPLITFAYPKGDVNGNGCLDSNDFILIKRYLLGTITLTQEQYQRARTTDKDIGSYDYIYVKKAVIESSSCSKTVSINITKSSCKAILEAKVDGSINLASRAYSWDNQKTWTNDNKLTITKEGTYRVYVKDSNNKVYSSEYIVSNLVPDDLKKGIINPQEFDIKTGKNITQGVAIKNLNNLNDALQCAGDNNITSLKIINGNYKFGVSDSNHITIPANTTLDLNNSTFYVYPNGDTAAALFEINNENVTIQNGVLEGDRYSHICNGGEWKVITSSKGVTSCRCHKDETAAGSTHENNHGISIKSTGAVIKKMEITNMMGDGVYISSPTGISSSKKQIKIVNSTIDNCRRNGISIVQGENILINNNLIKNTNGTAPQHGIDIEASKGKTFKKITISNNTIYGNGSHTSIMVFYRQISTGDISLNGVGEEGITINNNHLGDRMHHHRIPSKDKESVLFGGKGATGKAVTVYDNDREGIPIGTPTTYGYKIKNCVNNPNSLSSGDNNCGAGIVQCCTALNVCSK